MTNSPLPIPLSRSEQFSVCCDGAERPVYSGADFDYVHITTLDTVTVTVTTANHIEAITIRPSRRKKAYTIADGRTVTLTLARGDYYCLELNGNIERPLLLFADEPMHMSPYDGYTVMAFTTPGYYDVGHIETTSNLIVYIGEGVFLGAWLTGKDARNIRICGNGVLLRQNTEDDRHTPINLSRCEHVEINGITVIDNNAWNIRLHNCRHVVVENVKILSHQIWSDGIDIVGGEHILLRHLFIKNEDDCVCIKSSFNCEKQFEGFDVRHVLVEDCVFWNGPRGNSLEIGYKANNSVIEDILFRNVDVVHRETQENKFHRSIISIHNAGNATVRNITYENIYAESTDENFVQIAHMNQPRWGVGGGTIENITVRNLTLAGGELRPSLISAHTLEIEKACTTENITFENLTVLGKPVRSRKDAEDAGFTIDPDAKNVRFL